MKGEKSESGCLERRVRMPVWSQVGGSGWEGGC